MKEKHQLAIALGCVISNNKVLLAKRNEPKLPQIHNKWELPGGKIDFGEDPSKTAEREILEETGIFSKADYLLPFTYVAIRENNEAKINPIILCYKCDYINEKTYFKKPKKVSEISWVDIAEINPLEVQSGSLQFLQYILNKENLNQNQAINQNYLEFVCLKSFDYRINRYREYDILIETSMKNRNLFKVQYSWGRGQLYRKHKFSEYQSKDAMINDVGVTLKKRIHNGYVIKDKSINFPYFNFFEDMKIDKSDPFQLNLF